MKRPVRDVQKHMFYGYVIVIATVVVQHIAFGTYLTTGVFLDHVANAFGWMRASISGAYTIAFILAGISAFLGGTLSDRFGPRVVVAASVFMFGIAHVLLSQLSAIWQWYLFYCLIGMGIGAVEMIPLATIARWFVKKRGLMTGISKVGIGTGIMLVPMWTTFLITGLGWRSAYLILGLLVIGIGIPASQLFRRDPGKMHLLPDGEPVSDTSADYAETGLSVRKALGTWQLWVVCAMYFANAFCMQTVVVHIAPHAKSMGIAEVQANGLISMVGAVSIVSRLIMGYGADKIGNLRALIICLSVLVVALAWLQFADQLWELYLFIALYALNHGGIVTVISPAVAELFGTRSQGTLLGIVVLVGAASGSIGPLLAGYVFDVYGGYQPAFLILLGLAVFGLISSLVLRPIKGGYDEQG